MKTLAEKIAVMQAFDDGKKVECLVFGKWHASPVPSWDWINHDYRIAAEPKRLWVNEFPVGDACYRSRIEAEELKEGYTPIRTAVEYVEVIK